MDRLHSVLFNKKFTLYWREGKREIVEGASISDAYAKAGLGAGAIPSLDFYADGNDDKCEWNKETHEWNKKEREIFLNKLEAAYESKKQ